MNSFATELYLYFSTAKFLKPEYNYFDDITQIIKSGFYNNILNNIKIADRIVINNDTIVDKYNLYDLLNDNSLLFLINHKKQKSILKNIDVFILKDNNIKLKNCTDEKKCLLDFNDYLYLYKRKNILLNMSIYFFIFSIIKVLFFEKIITNRISVVVYNIIILIINHLFIFIDIILQSHFIKLDKQHKLSNAYYYIKNRYRIFMLFIFLFPYLDIYLFYIHFSKKKNDERRTNSLRRNEITLRVN